MGNIDHPKHKDQPRRNPKTPAMKPGNRRLLTNGSSPTPPPLPVTVPGKAAAQLYSSSNSMAVTALIILLALFFFGFFSVYAHRFVSGLRRSEARRWRARQQAARQQRGSRFEAACGLDPSAVLALPVLRYVGAGEGVGKEGCVVCLGEFEEKERVKVIPRCGHVFHPSCIDAWLVSRGSCPICRCSDVIASCSTSSVLGLEAEGAAAKEAGLGKRSCSCSWRGDQGAEKDKKAEVNLRRTCSL